MRDYIRERQRCVPNKTSQHHGVFKGEIVHVAYCILRLYPPRNCRGKQFGSSRQEVLICKQGGSRRGVIEISVLVLQTRLERDVSVKTH